MKLVASLIMDDSKTEPCFSPCYIFNNFRDCYRYFNSVGFVCKVHEPSYSNLYKFGELLVEKNEKNYAFCLRYADE